MSDATNIIKTAYQKGQEDMRERARLESENAIDGYRASVLVSQLAIKEPSDSFAAELAKSIEKIIVQALADQQKDRLSKRR